MIAEICNKLQHAKRVVDIEKTDLFCDSNAGSYIILMIRLRVYGALGLR